MRCSTKCILLILSIFPLSSLAQQARPSVPAFIADQVIVAFHPGTPASSMAEAHRQASATAIRTLDAIGATVVRIAGGSVTSAVSSYTRNPNVRYAEPNYLRVMIMPNEGQDPQPPIGLGIDYFAEQYYLHSDGQDIYYNQFTGEPGAITTSPGADINAPEAWDLHVGNDTTTVAVLDTGVECDHADLVGKCVEQINLGQSTTVTDDFGHGTLVASVIGANSNNGIGIAGVSWGTRIASIKVCYELFDIFFGLLGVCDAASSAAGMIHAADMGYQVINMSYAGPDAAQVEADAAAYAWNAGLVLTASAANSYSQQVMYPAGFPEVISVAATDYFDNLAGFSNFGPSVSLAAPGATIFAAFPHAACGLQQGDPEGCFGWADGTSFSSPLVAGAAALVWSSMAGGATNELVRSALELNADEIGALGQNMLAWTQHGRLNLYAAVANAGGGPPPPPAGPGVHVGDLDGASVNSGPNWSANVTITLHDETEAPANGRTVYGQWDDGGNAQCVTNNGQCMVSSNSYPKRTGTIGFTVTNVSGGDYVAGTNHDPEPDSNGSAITVAK